MDFAEHRLCQEQALNSAELLDGLLRVSQIVRLRFNDWLGRFELNDGRHAVLTALAHADHGGCSQAELAEQLGQSESNISTLIERMQRDGLVNRLRSEADRRKRVLLITEAGRSALAMVDASRSAWAGRLLNGLSADDRPMLLTLLQQLGSSLVSSSTVHCIGRATSTVSMVNDSATTFEHHVDPTEDPESPHFALRQMLLAMSSTAGDQALEKEVA